MTIVVFVVTIIDYLTDIVQQYSFLISLFPLLRCCYIVVLFTYSTIHSVVLPTNLIVVDRWRAPLPLRCCPDGILLFDSIRYIYIPHILPTAMLRCCGHSWAPIPHLPRPVRLVNYFITTVFGIVYSICCSMIRRTFDPVVPVGDAVTFCCCYPLHSIVVDTYISFPFLHS